MCKRLVACFSWQAQLRPAFQASKAPSLGTAALDSPGWPIIGQLNTTQRLQLKSTWSRKTGQLSPAQTPDPQNYDIQ